MGQKGAWPRSRDLFFYFGTPVLSLIRMKLTSNIVGGLRVRNIKQKVFFNGPKGCRLGHLTYFCTLDAPGISERLKLQYLNFAGGL